MRFLKRIKDAIRIATVKKKLLYYEGNFDSWSAAMTNALKWGGAYGQESILDKVAESTNLVRLGLAVYEQDGVTFDKMVIDYELISSFLYAYAIEKKLSVVDFGGALGSLFYKYKTLWDELNVRWSIVEQRHFVDFGKQNIPEIKFHYNVDECEPFSNVLLLASVLQYIEEPYTLLQSLLRKGYAFVIFDRTVFGEDGDDMISCQFVPKSINEAVYPVRMLSYKKIEQIISEEGYRIKNEWNCPIGGIPLIKGMRMMPTLEKGLLIERVR